MFKALRVLRKGHLVEVDRAGLVTGDVGRTASRTLERCKEARDAITGFSPALCRLAGCHVTPESGVLRDAQKAADIDMDMVAAGIAACM